ncbi:MAG: CaiB/BaiF CoA-transferase family protein [Crocinitomicaceae bacterium]|nr:CaiB/BaiF CoA-transferase family protein [Crocinitomicaceae bacterium]
MHRDLTVIDASSVLAGPSVATYFAELGAQVIKIEHPKHADVTRSWKLPSEDADSNVSAYFSSINYKKKYVTLDLKASNDHAEFMDLVSKADILITNFKKGDDIKLNITDEVIHALNPRLIIGKINGYGTESDRVAYDLILQAESGFMSMNGTPESGPVKMPVALIDVLSAHHLKEAILLALYERERTKKGKSVSVSLYDAAISSLSNQASNYLMSGHVPQRIGSLHPNIAPYGEIFTTIDGVQITFAIGSDTHFEKLCKVLHLEKLSVDERFSSNQKRVTNRLDLAKIIQDVITGITSDEILNEMNALNVPAGKIKNLKEVFQEEAAQALVRTEKIDGIETKRITSIVQK